MTDPLNLPAPGRRQTLYVHFTCLQSPVFLVNSRNPHFAATCRRFGSKSLHTSRPTFFRSYGGNLPSSLERVLSSALGFSPRPPESVCGTDDSLLHAMLFLEAWDHLSRAVTRYRSPSGMAAPPLFVWNTPTAPGRASPSLVRLPFSVTPRFIGKLTAQEY